MDIVVLEKSAFEQLLSEVRQLTQRVEMLSRKCQDKRFQKWLTGEDVCEILEISQRSLQTMRSKHKICYAQFVNDNVIAETLESLRKANRKANALMESYKPVLHGERLMTDGELATALRVSPRALRDYRNEGILPYIRMKGNILYRESDVERVLKRCIRGKMTLQSG